LEKRLSKVQFAGTQFRFQLPPDGLPVLRRRFHDGFFHVSFGKPPNQSLQLIGGSAEDLAFKGVITLDRDIGNNHRQHLFMNVDSRYSVFRHARLSRAGEAERAA
jgi:hypothetical protein